MRHHVMTAYLCRPIPPRIERCIAHSYLDHTFKKVA